jgi:hypothetical protein
MIIYLLEWWCGIVCWCDGKCFIRQYFDLLVALLIAGSFTGRVEQYLRRTQWPRLPSCGPLHRRQVEAFSVWGHPACVVGDAVDELPWDRVAISSWLCSKHLATSLPTNSLPTTSTQRKSNHPYKDYLPTTTTQPPPYKDYHDHLPYITK